MTSAPHSAEDQSTVLILDDEEGLANLYSAWLSTNNSVKTTYTASGVRETFDESVDVALIDRRLPNESGDQVVHWIHQQNPECRIAMLTAVNPDFDIIEMPLDTYLIKPVEKSQLVATVESLHTLQEYGDAVRELYALLMKRDRLERVKSHRELATSEEYEAVQTEIAEASTSTEKAVFRLLEAGDMDETFQAIEAVISGE